MPVNDVASLEALFASFEEPSFRTVLGASSGMKMVETAFNAHAPADDALTLYKANPLAGLTLVTDAFRRYLAVDPGQHEHPKDGAVVALLLLTEKVFGVGSPEVKVTSGVAEKMKNLWLVKMFLHTRGLRTL